MPHWINPNPANAPPSARGKSSWYLYDGLGSVLGEVDCNGHMTSSAKYDVYGAKRAGGTGTATSRQGFVGQLGHMTDSETGLIYMRARYYDPNTGRFVSEDPGFHGSNWYSYCDNSPINKADLDGKFPYLLMEVIGALIDYTTSVYYERGKISTGAAIAAAVIGSSLIVAGIVYDIMEATSWLREIGASRPVMLIEAVMDTIVPSLKEQGGFQSVAGHMLEVELGVMDIDEQ